MLSPKASPRPPTSLLQLDLWPWITQVLPGASHSRGCRQGSLSLRRHRTARFLRWSGALGVKGRGGSLAQGQQQLRVGEEAHSCSPGSLPRASRETRALSARPIYWKETSVTLPSHSCGSQNTELPWHSLAHGEGTARPKDSHCNNMQPSAGPQPLLYGGLKGETPDLPHTGCVT